MIASSHNCTFRMSSGNLQGSRWGLRGQEDLGGGMKAIFALENGFDMANGRSTVKVAVSSAVRLLSV